MPISFLHRFSLDPPHCRTAAKWTALLTLTAAVASFAPEFIFTNATSLHSSFSKSCRRDGYIRIPLDLPGDVLCLPAGMVNRSSLDFFVPTVFAALGVGVSACFVRSLELWGQFWDFSIPFVSVSGMKISEMERQIWKFSMGLKSVKWAIQNGPAQEAGPKLNIILSVSVGCGFFVVKYLQLSDICLDTLDFIYMPFYVISTYIYIFFFNFYNRNYPYFFFFMD